MAHLLIVYSTTEGQTARIAHEMSGWLAAKGHQVEAHRVQDLPAAPQPGEFDAVIAGSPMHQSSYDPALAGWLAAHRDLLSDAYSAFFSVSLSAASQKDGERAELERLTEAYLARTGWKPDRVAYFAGALAYSRYGLLTRLMMQRIARKEGGETDPSRDYEYTDWTAVRQFADEAAERCVEAAREV